MSIHFDSSCTALDNVFWELLTSYSSDPMPLLYLLCGSFNLFVYVSWSLTIPLCGVSEVSKVIIYLKSLLNPWVILVIRCIWYILRVILVGFCLIVHPTKSYSVPIDQVSYYFLVYSIVSINTVFYSISSVSYTYTMKISVPRSFTLYNKQGSILHYLNTALGVILLMYSFNQKHAACMRP